MLRGGVEVKVEHVDERGGVAAQAAAKRGAFPAIDQEARHAARVGMGGYIASRSSHLETTREPVGDLGKALLDPAPEHFTHPGKLLTQSSQQAAHVAFFPVFLLRHLEEMTHALEGAAALVAKTDFEPFMHLLHVAVDDLEREVFLSLLGEEKTQARIQSILTTNKPLRN